MDKFVWKENELPEKEMMPGIWLKSIYHDQQQVTLVTFKPFAQVPEHSHEEQQISVIIEGKMDVIINGERISVHKGDVLVLPPGTVHGVEVSPRGAKAVETWNKVVDEYVIDQAPEVEEFHPDTDMVK